ncbi:MAG: hypothetical protein RLZZ292_440 [Bacteroidota bacterium]|jgi:hypothetical protein
MKKSNLIFPLLFLLLWCSLAVAQTPKHKIQIGQYSLEPISESLNRIRLAKTLSGVYYEHLINENFSLNFGAQYSKRLVYDVCTNCGDAFVGIGNFKETNFLVGVRYNDLPNNRFLKPFLQGDLFYGKSNYKGTFGGGIAGNLFFFDGNYQKVGAVFRFGVDFLLLKNISIAAMTSFKANFVQKTELFNTLLQITREKQTAWLPLDLRIGLAF